jgi:NADH dehydrogenase
LGVTVQTKSMVTDIAGDIVTYKRDGKTEKIPAHTILWAAGVKASAMGQILADRAGATLDRAGRVMVEPDLTIAGQPNIFAIGDLAHFAHQGDKPLPGVAPVAVQEGEYVAKLLKKRLKGETLPAFSYLNAGSLAVIGQNSAVVDLGFVKLTGAIAWLAWVFVHIYYLIEFDNKLIVMLQWGWNYFTRNRGARLITGEGKLIQVEQNSNGEYRTPPGAKSPVEA